LAGDRTIRYNHLTQDPNRVPVKIYERALVFILFSSRPVKEKKASLQELVDGFAEKITSRTEGL